MGTVRLMVLMHSVSGDLPESLHPVPSHVQYMYVQLAVCQSM
jgi:hypothetical protein